MKYKFLVLGVTLFLLSCNNTATVVQTPILVLDSAVQYQGRIGINADGSKLFYWPGTSAEMKFKSNHVSFEMNDTKGDNYYNVTIDGTLVEVIKPNNTRSTYNFKVSPDQEHIINVLKISELDRGITSFSGFDIGKSGTILPLKNKKNSMVFYGNSITCGYGVDDTVGDSPEGTNTNFSKSYARLTAKKFDAQYQVIAKSGIGIMISWFPLIMPEMYNRIDPSNDDTLWDYKQDKTDVVVINLFQNDSWLVNKPELDVFKERFGTSKPTEEEIIKAYKGFLLTIRASHSKAHIICMLGNMDITESGSKWPGYVAKAVKESGDAKVYTLVVPYKNTEGHPEEAEQKALATALIELIEQKKLLEH